MKHLLLTTIAAVLLVGCGPSPNELINEAAYKGNIEAVKQHLADGADVNARDANGMTPLHNAAVYGHNEIAELLIAKGAGVNANVNGDTPLHNAAWGGNKEIIELLNCQRCECESEGWVGRYSFACGG
jgi:ankyrin repeat protein